MTTDYALNIMRCFRTASESDINEGIHWYDNTRRLATDWADGNVWKGAGVIAAYSPLTPWWRNLELAKDSLLTGSANSNHMPVFVNKAQAILDGAPVLPTLNGPKLTAFASAIADPNTRLITVDVHAYSIAIGVHSPRAKFGIRVYRAIAAAYLECADYTGYTPSQFQAITWSSWRNRYGKHRKAPIES